MGCVLTPADIFQIGILLGVTMTTLVVTLLLLLIRIATGK